MRLSVVVPTMNAGLLWDHFAAALLKNLHHCRVKPNRVLVLDSASTDQTAERAERAGFRVLSIPRNEFDHGRTRQLAVTEEGDADFLIFLTQDALLAGEDALAKLLVAFKDPAVGAAYGRQLPRQGASGLEAHARLFNYPDKSKVRCFQDRETMGFKSIFASNSFCAYRRAALLEVGGFPSPTLCSEETIAIGRMHMIGWYSAYVADAQVYHSHALTIPQEARRYFDLGVTHARYPFLLDVFGTTAGEGKRFVISECRFLLQNSPMRLPEAGLRTLTKLVTYQLGRKESWFGLHLRRLLSVNRGFWSAGRDGGLMRPFVEEPRDFLTGPPPSGIVEKAARLVRDQQPALCYLPQTKQASQAQAGRQRG